MMLTVDIFYVYVFVLSVIFSFHYFELASCLIYAKPLRQPFC